MKTIFLDTHIWNYLFERPKYSDDQLRQARERLLEGVRNGEWEVVCSLPILQEILAIYREKPEKFEVINSLLFEAVKNHWLIELKERYVSELQSGGLLKQTDRYLDRANRRKIAALASKKKDVANINDITHQEGIDFKTQQEDARAKVYTELGSADGKTLKDSRKAYEHWFKKDRDLRGWVLKVLEGGVTRGLYKASLIKDFEPTKENSPSVWQYVDFRQAKVRLELGERRKILESDAVDADTYGCSPYYDVLVTQDKKFRDAIELVIDDEFELQNFEELMYMLGITS